MSVDKPETSSSTGFEPPENRFSSTFTIPGYHDFRFQNQEPKKEETEEDEGSEKCNRKRRINREQFISHYFTSGCKSKRIKTSRLVPLVLIPFKGPSVLDPFSLEIKSNVYLVFLDFISSTKMVDLYQSGPFSQVLETKPNGFLDFASRNG